MVSPSDVLIFQTPVRVTLTTATHTQKKKEREREGVKTMDYFLIFLSNGTKIFSSLNVIQEEKWAPGTVPYC